MELTRELSTIVQSPPPAEQRIDVTIQMRAKHADLLRAVRKMGGNQQLADHLGITRNSLYLWLSMRAAPMYWNENSKWSTPEFKDPLAEKLLALTGKHLTELWPLEIFTKEFMDQDKTGELETQATQQGVLLTGFGPQALPSPYEVAEQHEIKGLVSKVVKMLTYREKLVIEARYGLGEHAGVCQTYEEVGTALKVSKERVRQIERKALRRLQHKSRTKYLQDYSGEEDECP